MKAKTLNFQYQEWIIFYEMWGMYSVVIPQQQTSSHRHDFLKPAVACHRQILVSSNENHQRQG